MPRLFSRVGVCVLLLLFSVIGIGTAPVFGATTYLFTAESISPDITSFSLTFVDNAKNGLLTTGDTIKFITPPVLYPGRYNVTATGIQQIPKQNTNPSDPDGGYSPLTSNPHGGNLWVFYCDPSLPPYYSNTFSYHPDAFIETITPIGSTSSLLPLLLGD
jgi:hypothetical protein